MKRCPQCEFIYEEEQSHCDMDGALLLHDPRALLDTARTRRNHPHRSTRKLFVQLALPLAILASLSFYALRSQTGPHPTPAAASRLTGSDSGSVGASSSASDGSTNINSGTASNSAVGTPAPNQSESASAQDSQDQSVRSADAANNPNVEPNHENSSTNNGAASSPSKREARPQRATPPKKESKVSSFLKKTGKFFKRRFER